MSDTAWRATFTAMTILVFLAPQASAADDPLGVGHTHEGDVGKFYQTWKKPDNRDMHGERIQNCCGNQDCRPILEMRKNRSGYGYRPGQENWFDSTWEVLINVPYDNFPKWIPVPDSIWEDNQPDPRESPDERGHACVTYSGAAICAVRASGQ